ncbi:uncharacterized protein LOC126832859 [Adelges cooleyi]|uniref:uncharacterized protein LOC126832859 n=1 Tax=Adelges cooleyi TaxID=133065 RepID=UPI0021804E20|nr:uncharacterized protein LOC126832859 [Adelges cooleyi]
MKVFIFLCVLKVLVVHCNDDNEDNDKSMLMCMKDNFSLCGEVNYPRRCLNLDSVVIANKFYLHNRLESLVIDLALDGSRCVVLFNEFLCQGSYLILNGTDYPSAVLYEFDFSNRAVSVVACSDKLLDRLNSTRSNRSSEYTRDAIPSNSFVVDKKQHLENYSNYKQATSGGGLKGFFDWNSEYKHSDETQNPKTPLTVPMNDKADRKKLLDIHY